MVQIDISMPHSCDDCPFLLVDYKTNVPDCDLMEDLPNCPEYDWNTPMGQKDKNCPLKEVPNGKWTNDGGPFLNRWICSECGYKHYLEPTKFCSGCGADMREEPKKIGWTNDRERKAT